MSKFEELALVLAQGGHSAEEGEALFFSLVDSIRTYPSEVFLNAAIRKLLLRTRRAGQIAASAARVAFAVTPFASSQAAVLVAFPCVVFKEASAEAWQSVREHLATWIAAQPDFIETVVRVDMASRPYSTASLEGLFGKSQMALAHSLTTDGCFTLNIDSRAQQGEAALWPVALRVPAMQAQVFENRLAAAPPADAAFVTLKHRMEEIAEQQGTFFNLYPLCRWETVFSLSRFAAFRLRLMANKAALKGRSHTMVLAEDVLYSEEEAGRFRWGRFPEETTEDIQNLVEQAGKALSVGLRFEQATYTPKL